MPTFHSFDWVKGMERDGQINAFEIDIASDRETADVNAWTNEQTSERASKRMC